ncbi:FadR/GntR family transcriptional regulator [Geobacter sp. SVR]|uniref:FadR/GntR family transcriptional regulator n=1 Tax=Geobacter sp. SVR TaxID=2495594 RepID=UPI00143EFFDD|nr:FadR/GntR family transcriptional regulator [Geobacter sp. SVR]BCS52618.1 GntR family transcriptional regulator [Geobacter sp. SVR]GCF83944.1 GntR family transcriptional regulator [Geobacter sp. SVR]
MTFKPIRPQKITVQIADQIRASILTAAFGPGEKLPTERELCRIFGVSRPSVREALNILAAAGLVESHQGGGTTVRSLVEASAGSPLSELIKYERERALDVIEVRKSIEACTAFYAADRALPEDVRRLEKIVSEMEENLATETPSLDLDADFHIAVARATHNVVWLHLMQNIFDAMQQFQRGVWRAVYLTVDDHRTLYRQHRDVFEAIRDRQPESARTAMLVHLGFAEQRSGIYVSRNGADRTVSQ